MGGNVTAVMKTKSIRCCRRWIEALVANSCSAGGSVQLEWMDMAKARKKWSANKGTC